MVFYGAYRKNVLTGTIYAVWRRLGNSITSI